MTDQVCERGREAFRKRVWSDAYADLNEADRAAPLAPADLDLLASAAYLVGRDEEADEASARAYRAWLDDGLPRPAARRAAWLGIVLLLRGEFARSNAWCARAEELLEGVEGGPAPECGMLLVGEAYRRLGDGEVEKALALSTEVAEIGRRYGDPDLSALGALGLGEALIERGEVPAGMRSLDEAMVAVTAGEVSVEVSGILYCAVILACQMTFDLPRAREWTSVLDRWCLDQPGLTPYRGQCLVHRAQIMQVQGSWPEAADEAQRACQLLGEHPAAGGAHYQLGELHRLRGQLDQADRSFREASRWLAAPEPGLALLRLSQGRTGEATSGIRQALAGTTGLHRARLLGACVSILLAADLPLEAEQSAAELTAIARSLDSPLLRAMAAQAEGECAVARGDGSAALVVLRAAWAEWRELGAPYESAQVRMLMARAHRALGDQDAAEMELDAAEWVFDQLGAMPDVHRVRALSSRATEPHAGPLTHREVEVLRLVATGLTNRAVAAELFLSEKTVARHLSNIFAKVGVNSRAAATAYAFRNGLVGGQPEAR
ncbi:MAG TPA: LuxR C-terminal-related transcriptional regulator [Nocardioides sp.]|nr:LuxR C-terminal-related transcriptional regulator [Nocardioides sp.]